MIGLFAAVHESVLAHRVISLHRGFDRYRAIADMAGLATGLTRSRRPEADMGRVPLPRTSD